jgi:eukaryotic-like serine/threonine-protein kinase
MASPDQRLTNALSGRYRIERELGAGGMATVYLAEDVKHGRQVAVKVLRPELSAALGPDRFPREIRILARLQHPHILPLHDSGEMDGFLFYTMPFVDGESLRERMDREGALPVQDAVRIMREVADALTAAHGMGVLHRDIKPANVMLSGRHALVTDFGVAKAVRDAGGDTLTTVGIAVGTPTYMSPEQATGQTDVDARSDVYAVGVLAYEMLTGAPPFNAKNASAMLSAHVLEKPVPVREKREAVPPGLNDVVMRCLEKDPDARFPNAEALLTALEDVFTPSGGITPTTTRPTKTVAPAPAVVAVPQPFAEPKSKSRLPMFAALVFVLVAAAGGLWWRFGAGGGVAKSTAIERIAVLPFRDISGQDKVFAESMQDAVITGIAGMQRVGVVPRSEIASRGENARISDIAAEFKVNAVLEGTLFRAGDVMRINMQLVEPETVRHYWSGSFEIDVRNVLAAQDSLVKQINAQVRAVLDGQTKPKGTGG